MDAIETPAVPAEPPLATVNEIAREPAPAKPRELHPLFAEIFERHKL